MPLQIDIRNIADYEAVCLVPTPERKGGKVPFFEFAWDSEHVLCPHLTAIVVTAMQVGLGELTAKSLDEWALRFERWQDAFGALMRADDRDVRITRADLARFTGLTVNVAPMTRRQFNAHLRRSKARE